jgi:hypothetical protein
MQLVKETDCVLASSCNLTRNISQESGDFYNGTHWLLWEFVVRCQYLSSFVFAVLLSNICCVLSVWYVCCCCVLWRSLVFRLCWMFSHVCSELSVLYVCNSFVMWRFTAFSLSCLFYILVLTSFLPVRVVCLLFCVVKGFCILSLSCFARCLLCPLLSAVCCRKRMSPVSCVLQSAVPCDGNVIICPVFSCLVWSDDRNNTRSDRVRM